MEIVRTEARSNWLAMVVSLPHVRESGEARGHGVLNSISRRDAEFAEIEAASHLLFSVIPVPLREICISNSKWLATN